MLWPPNWGPAITAWIMLPPVALCAHSGQPGELVVLVSIVLFSSFTLCVLHSRPFSPALCRPMNEVRRWRAPLFAGMLVALALFTLFSACPAAFPALDLEVCRQENNLTYIR